MKAGLIVMLWIVGQRINGGAIYWMAYSLFVLAALFGGVK